MQQGGDLGTIYRRMVAGVTEIEQNLPFSHSARFGFLTFCPTNLGTTIRASVHIKLPKLAADKALLDETAARYNLQVSL
jgi:arginine kinase